MLSSVNETTMPIIGANTSIDPAAAP